MFSPPFIMSSLPGMESPLKQIAGSKCANTGSAKKKQKTGAKKKENVDTIRSFDIFWRQTNKLKNRQEFNCVKSSLDYFV